MFIWLATAFIILISSIVWYERARFAQFRQFPSPGKAWPLLGHLPFVWQLRRKSENQSVANILESLAQQFPDEGLYHIKLGWSNLLYVYSSEYANKILKSNFTSPNVAYSKVSSTISSYLTDNTNIIIGCEAMVSRRIAGDERCRP